MQSYSGNVLDLTYNILRAHGAEFILHKGGLNVSRAHSRDAMRIGDIASIIGDFEKLATCPDLVAQALAAYALNKIGIQHSIPTTGLTISIRTPKATIPVSLTGYVPINYLRSR